MLTQAAINHCVALKRWPEHMQQTLDQYEEIYGLYDYGGLALCEFASRLWAPKREQ